MKFKYQARTKEGELQVGFVEAGSKEAAENILNSHELFILLLEEVGEPNFFQRLNAYFKRVKIKDLVIFYRQMAILFESQLPLNKILETLYNQTSNLQLKEAAFQVLEDIQGGLSFSQAIEKQASVFSPFAASMIRAGEVTGNLDRSVAFLADYTEREYSLISKTRSAMVYPLIIIFTFIIVSILMVTIVFPQIKPVFEQAGVKLPFFASVLLGIGDFLTQWWWIVILFLIMLIGLLIDFFQTMEGKSLLDEFKIKLPFLKRVFIPILMSRFANIGTTLIRGGIPVAQSLEIIANTINNVLYKEIFDKISEDVKAGMSLSEAIMQYPNYFPELVHQMIIVGEQTGQLYKILQKISDFYSKEVDNIVNNLTDLIQPFLIIGIGILVGFLFASILIPIYNLTSSIG